MHNTMHGQRANCNYNIPPNPANKEVGQVAYLQTLSLPEVDGLFTDINRAIADAAKRAHEAVRPSCGSISIKPHLWSPDTKLLYEYSKWIKISKRRIN